MIGLFEAQDGEGLGLLVSTTTLPCGTELLQPRCDGEPQGTPFDVVPWGGCQPSFATEAEAKATLGAIAGGDYHLYAIYENEHPLVLQFTVTQLLLGTDFGPDGAFVVSLDGEGRIVGYNRTCGNPVTSSIPGDAVVILAPVSH